MSELRELLTTQLDRLLAAHPVLRAVEAGEWPAALWAEAEALGLGLALVPEGQGGVGLSWGDAAAVWQVLGRHGAPLPLGEQMLAARLLAEGGMEAPDGLLALALAGGPAPWGRHAAWVVAVEGARVALLPAGDVVPGTNLGREPRDRLGAAAPAARGLLPDGRLAPLGLALLRAAQVAGALEAVLALAVDWANTRKQFGRPIGKFQAVQQQLAAMAGEVALAGVAVAAAARAADARGLAGAEFEVACAKVVAGEAATLGAATAHQVFAAIGITEDHALHHLTRRLWSWREEGGTERAWATEAGRLAMGWGGHGLWAGLTARDVTEEGR
ncbi:acyl-CoA dehydrogenase family protein [Roseococcus sp. DSY-14]|uniref:acyl-CoA dehydrogenase family protein n=1 Tax=Roseococcus sp. DSY-14 TaxID=3369650 RepID=UPI00387B90B1